MSDSDKTVFQAFWHGPDLTPLHFAALSSFVSHGHRLHLYSYRQREVPPGVELRDASEVLPESALFHFRNPHTSTPDLGPFSDLFRFKLLADRGGWYVDVDTFCLSGDIPAFEYAWARENPDIVQSVGSSQIALPAGSALARKLAERSAVKAGNFEQREDVGPKLLTLIIEEAELPMDMNGSAESFYPVKWIESVTLWLPDFSDEIEARLERALFLPYYQSMPRYLGFLDEGLPPEGSVLRRLMDAQAPAGQQGGKAVPVQRIQRSAAKWFAEVPWAAPEFVSVTGRDVQLVLRDGPKTYDKLAGLASEPHDVLKESTDMSDGLDGALAKIDEVIIALFRERERLVSTITEVTAKQASLAPFVVPFAVGVPRRVRPFEELAPGFWIGYQESFGPAVTIVQNAEANPLLAPPDHHFMVSLDIEAPNGVPWITIEELVDHGDLNTQYRVTVALKAMASRRATIKFELSVPQVDAEDYRFQLGTLTVGRHYESAFLSQTIDFGDVPALKGNQRAKILAFLPVDAALSMSLAYYRVLLTKL